MHLRFDGFLGFPGGIIEENETIIEGVSREVHEEMNIDPKDLQLTSEDFVCRAIIDKSDEKFGRSWSKLKLYFFSKEISEEAFEKMEVESRKAIHFGTEILGNIRVPVHRWREIDGLPRFLTNAFAGTAKPQLCMALCKHNILPKENVMEAYKMHHK